MKITEKSLTEQYISNLPKTELHVHLDGTLEAELMFDVAQRNQVPFPYNNVEETRAAYQFNNLQEFLNLYFLGAGVMKTEQDFYDLTYAYLKKAREDGVLHTEMFVGPQTHTWKPDITIDTVMGGTIRAIRDAEKNLGITSSIIIDFNRSFVNDPSKIAKPGWQEQAQTDAPADAEKTYASVQDYLQRKPDNKKHVIGFGLDYAENGFPPEWFQPLFSRIIGDGFKTVCHAGEEGPAEYVQQAIDLLQVSRVDHGYHAFDDAQLTARIAAEKIPLTMCPLSNQKLQVFPDLTKHPLKQMFDLGVKVTLNSDDPAYFGGYVNDNYKAITKALDLQIGDIHMIARNSIEASFLAPEKKEALLGQLDIYHATFMAQHPELNDGKPHAWPNKSLAGDRQ